MSNILIIKHGSLGDLIQANGAIRDIKKFYENSYDYVSNTIKRTFPIGYDVEIFSFEVLENAWKNAKLPSEREAPSLELLFESSLKALAMTNRANKSAGKQVACCRPKCQTFH